MAFTIPLFGQRLPDLLTQEAGVLLAYARVSGTLPGMAPMGAFVDADASSGGA